MKDERVPLGELIDRMRDGVNEAFENMGYKDVSFVLIAQDGETGFGGMAANCANEGSKTLLGVALQQLEKGPLRVIQ